MGHEHKMGGACSTKKAVDAVEWNEEQSSRAPIHVDGRTATCDGSQENAAAVKIQSRFRGHSVRKTDAKRKQVIQAQQNVERPAAEVATDGSSCAEEQIAP